MPAAVRDSLAVLMETGAGASGSGEGEDDCAELPFDTPVFKVVAAIRASIGVCSLLVCLAVVVLLTMMRKHYFLDQRLVLYLAIASLCHSASYIIGRVDFDGSRPISETYCKFAGFLETYTSGVELLAILNITVNILVFKLWRNRLEFVYLTLMFGLPLLWSWLPFLYDGYATSGPWCGIRTLEPADCDVYMTGRLLKLLVWHMPVLVFTVLSLSVAVTVLWKLKRKAKNWGSPNCNVNQQFRKLRKGILLIPVVYVLLKVPILVTDIYEIVDPLILILLWFVRVFSSPPAGSAALLVYFLDSETWKRLTLSSLRAAMVRSCCWTEVEEVNSYSCECTFGDSVEGAGLRRMTASRRASSMATEVVTV